MFLIKSGLKLNKNRNLLAVLRRLCKCCDDRRIAGYAVKCLLDCKHIRINGCLADKVDHRIKGLVWVMQENVSVSYRSKDVGSRLDLRNRLRSRLLIAQMVIALQPTHLHKEG